MTLRNLNTKDLPLWLQRYWERIQNGAFFEMIEENEQYQGLHKECKKLEDNHKVITHIIEGDAAKDSFPLKDDEVKALSKFLQKKKDMNELEAMKIYLMGCRDMYYMLRILKLVE